MPCRIRALKKIAASLKKSEAFEVAFPIGTPCVYYPIRPFREKEAFQSRIRSKPWVLGHGAVVVAIEGKAGGVSIDHIVEAR